MPQKKTESINYVQYDDETALTNSVRTPEGQSGQTGW